MQLYCFTAFAKKPARSGGGRTHDDSAGCSSSYGTREIGYRQALLSMPAKACTAQTGRLTAPAGTGTIYSGMQSCWQLYRIYYRYRRDQTSQHHRKSLTSGGLGVQGGSSVSHAA